MDAGDYRKHSRDIIPIMERSRLGIWQAVRRYHFIQATGRYTRSMLRMTYDTINETFPQNVTVIVGRGSRNAAISETLESLTPIQEQLINRNIGFRIMEVGSRSELQQGVSMFEHRGWAQAAMGLLVMHGSPYGVDLMDDQDYSRQSKIDAIDTKYFLAPLLRKLVEEKGLLVSLACSFPEPGGGSIGEAIHRETDLELYGSSAEVAVSSLTLSMIDGKPRIYPRFQSRTASPDGKTWIYQDSDTEHRKRTTPRL